MTVTQTTNTPLKGTALLQKISELENTGMTKSEIAITCGYSKERNGETAADITGLYSSLLANALGDNYQDPDEIRQASRSDYMSILQNGPVDWMCRCGEFHYEGWIFYTDVDHAGNISTTADVVTKYGFTDDKIWREESLEDFHVRYDWKGEWNDGADPAEYPDEYAKELAEFKTRRFCNISHCFYVTDPEGKELGYGAETPFGIIGSQEFTCWWNGIPQAMLAECDTNSWCDG